MRHLYNIVFRILFVSNAFFNSGIHAADSNINRIHSCSRLLSNIQAPVSYYIHPVKGNDANPGTSIQQPFQSLSQIEKIQLKPGDKIVLAANMEYAGSLKLVNQHGDPDNPITVTSIDWNSKKINHPALINFKNRSIGILVQDCSYLKISNLQLTGNGSEPSGEKSETRCAVLINNLIDTGMTNIGLDQLSIKDVYFENPGFVRDAKEVHSANGTQSYGWGIKVVNKITDHLIRNIQIQNCVITDVSHTGIKLTGNKKNIKGIKILNNLISYTGGPGIQMSEVQDVYVANNTVDHSGSNNDSRKWGRGSGLWTWGSKNILIEKNKFLHANGPGDSDGAHIDFNCENVIIQYNLSAYNAGGFCEILGNNYNAIYRYNISVNDGHRIKGKNGAFQEGKTLWLSGYQGDKQKRKGPVNTYIYNNTIYTDASIFPKIAFDNTSKNVVIANNIFYLVNPFQVVQGDQYKPDVSAVTGVENMALSNNLFLNSHCWPGEMPVNGAVSLFGNPEFAKPGGLQIQDYMPLNTALISNKGSKVVEWNMNNAKSLEWLKMEKDILGNPVSDHPSIGAIEPVAHSK